MYILHTEKQFKYFKDPLLSPETPLTPLKGDLGAWYISSPFRGIRGGLSRELEGSRGSYCITQLCRNRAPMMVLMAVNTALTITNTLFFFSSMVYCLQI